ncbi:bifunctional riboflavin kinase/FAD synthetase [bacterium]|nr:bifunctional riboflavin kinase/FAD synthetase [bacterium]
MKDFVLTVGNFDGVHLGHCKLLEKLHQIAGAYSCEPLIVTYQSHPKHTLKTKIEPYLLTTTSQKLELLRKCGFNHIELLNFTKDFANMSPYQFLKEELVDKFHPKAIVLGYDTKFGKDRKGDYDFIQKHEQEFNYKTYQVDPLALDDQIISSSLIRGLIKSGQLFRASQYLGRRFSFWGKVVEGKRLGRTLGYPTININALNASQLTPPDGVYLSQTLTQTGLYYSITNIGSNPTVCNSLDQKIESYILDFNQELYGQEVETSFLKKLRDEMKYSSIEELKQAIASDVLTSRRMINEITKIL